MKRKVKFLTTIILLLSLIFFLIIRFNYPMRVTRTESIFHTIPIYYWILLIVVPVTISITFILTNDKYVYVFLAIMYFFYFYSFFLFFLIPPRGGDMPQGGHVFHTLENTATLTVEQISYFEYPIHFSLYKTFLEILGGGPSILTTIVFSFLLMFPLILYINRKKYDKKVYFLLPIGYILFAEYTYINYQWVPQFTALIFLILTIGCYFKYKEHDSRVIYFLILFFYTICVFTHPFIFVFFPVSIFINRYIIPRKIFKPSFKTSNKISLISLMVIFLSGFLYRFSIVQRSIKGLLIGGKEGRGEAWNIIGHLLRDQESIRGSEYETYLLFDIVSENIYLISRNSILILLFVLTSILGYILLKNLSKLKSIDISFIISGSVFYFLGLFEPLILGQRGFQIIFLGIPSYFYIAFNSKKRIFILVIIIALTVAPFLVSVNRAVNQDIAGGRQVQDEYVISSGKFVLENTDDETDILTAELSFYPGREYNHTLRIVDGTTSLNEIDLIIESPKQHNRMRYYGIQLEYDNYSFIYDNGESQILLQRPNK